MEQYIHNLVKKAKGQLLNKNEKEVELGFGSWLVLHMSEVEKAALKAAHLHTQTYCVYCRKILVARNDSRYSTKTKDHLIPLSKGGLNVAPNRRTCCESCNQWKSDLYLEDWLKEVREKLKKNKTYRKVTPERMAIMVGCIRSIIKEIQPIKHKLAVYKNAN